MSNSIFVGSFDPWHNGHMDRLTNALKIFDSVTVVVADNPSKKVYWFNQQERVELIKKCVKHFGNRVIVKRAQTKMIHEICHEEKIFNVFRGIKSGRTFEEEIRLQVYTKYMANKDFEEDIFFVYDITSEDDFRGASIVKNLALLEKDLTDFLSKEIISDIKERSKLYK